MDFRYRYGKKRGVRSTSVVLSEELRDAIDEAYGDRQRSAFLERAGWLLLALLDDDKDAIDRWLDWSDKNTSLDERDRFAHGREYFSY